MQGGDLAVGKRSLAGRKYLLLWVLLSLLVFLSAAIVLVLKSNSNNPQLLDENITKTGSHTTADLSLFYAQIDNGDAFGKLTAMGGDPQKCLDEISLEQGVQKVCTWHNQEASVTVVFLNDGVIAKTKVGL